VRDGFLFDVLSRLFTADTAPAGALGRFHAETVVSASLQDTFRYFSDASNLEPLTPPWLRFRIVTPLPIVMGEGAEIRYRIAIHGLPVPWTSRIDHWEVDRRFVDRQIVGPYRWWRHEHRFEPVAGGTRVIDDVEFVPRLSVVTRRFVSRDIAAIFAYRRDALQRLLSPG
jgi:ligand-binding SRPBCC domain-containing protein